MLLCLFYLTASSKARWQDHLFVEQSIGLNWQLVNINVLKTKVLFKLGPRASIDIYVFLLSRCRHRHDNLIVKVDNGTGTLHFCQHRQLADTSNVDIKVLDCSYTDLSVYLLRL